MPRWLRSWRRAPPRRRRKELPSDAPKPGSNGRIAPLTGTTTRVARAGPLIGLAGNRGQFDCIDTTNNTNALLLILNELKLLRHHTIAAPVSRFLFTEGPHNTAMIKDHKTNELWTVDPWTHKGSEVPDIFPLAKWKGGE